MSTFKNRIIDYVVSQVIANFLKSLNPEELRVVLDTLVDKIEDVVEHSDNKFDDNLLPILDFVRDFFNIPDLPDN